VSNGCNNEESPPSHSTNGLKPMQPKQNIKPGFNRSISSEATYSMQTPQVTFRTELAARSRPAMIEEQSGSAICGVQQKRVRQAMQQVTSPADGQLSPGVQSLRVAMLRDKLKRELGLGNKQTPLNEYSRRDNQSNTASTCASPTEDSLDTLVQNNIAFVSSKASRQTNKVVQSPRHLGNTPSSASNSYNSTSSEFSSQRDLVNAFERSLTKLPEIESTLGMADWSRNIPIGAKSVIVSSEKDSQAVRSTWNRPIKDDKQNDISSYLTQNSSVMSNEHIDDQTMQQQRQQQQKQQERSKLPDNEAPEINSSNVFESNKGHEITSNEVGHPRKVTQKEERNLSNKIANVKNGFAENQLVEEMGAYGHTANLSGRERTRSPRGANMARSPTSCDTIREFCPYVARMPSEICRNVYALLTSPINDNKFTKSETNLVTIATTMANKSYVSYPLINSVNIAPKEPHNKPSQEPCNQPGILNVGANSNSIFTTRRSLPIAFNPLLPNSQKFLQQKSPQTVTVTTPGSTPTSVPTTQRGLPLYVRSSSLPVGPELFTVRPDSLMFKPSLDTPCRTGNLSDRPQSLPVSPESLSNDLAFNLNCPRNTNQQSLTIHPISVHGSLLQSLAPSPIFRHQLTKPFLTELNNTTLDTSRIKDEQNLKSGKNLEISENDDDVIDDILSCNASDAEVVSGACNQTVFEANQVVASLSDFLKLKQIFKPQPIPVESAFTSSIVWQADVNSRHPVSANNEPSQRTIFNTVDENNKIYFTSTPKEDADKIAANSQVNQIHEPSLLKNNSNNLLKSIENDILSSSAAPCKVAEMVKNIQLGIITSNSKIHDINTGKCVKIILIDDDETPKVTPCSNVAPLESTKVECEQIKAMDTILDDQATSGFVVVDCLGRKLADESRELHKTATSCLLPKNSKELEKIDRSAIEIMQGNKISITNLTSAMLCKPKSTKVNIEDRQHPSDVERTKVINTYFDSKLSEVDDPVATEDKMDITRRLAIILNKVRDTTGPVQDGLNKHSFAGIDLPLDNQSNTKNAHIHRVQFNASGMPPSSFGTSPLRHGIGKTSKKLDNQNDVVTLKKNCDSELTNAKRIYDISDIVQVESPYSGLINSSINIKSPVGINASNSEQLKHVELPCQHCGNIEQDKILPVEPNLESLTETNKHQTVNNRLQNIPVKRGVIPLLNHRKQSWQAVLDGPPTLPIIISRRSSLTSTAPPLPNSSVTFVEIILKKLGGSTESAPVKSGTKMNLRQRERSLPPESTNKKSIIPIQSHHSVIRDTKDVDTTLNGLTNNIPSDTKQELSNNDRKVHSDGTGVKDKHFKNLLLNGQNDPVNNRMSLEVQKAGRNTISIANHSFEDNLVLGAFKSPVDKTVTETKHLDDLYNGALTRSKDIASGIRNNRQVVQESELLKYKSKIATQTADTDYKPTSPIRFPTNNLPSENVSLHKTKKFESKIVPHNVSYSSADDFQNPSRSRRASYNSVKAETSGFKGSSTQFCKPTAAQSIHSATVDKQNQFEKSNTSNKSKVLLPDCNQNNILRTTTSCCDSEIQSQSNVSTSKITLTRCISEHVTSISNCIVLSGQNVVQSHCNLPLAESTVEGHGFHRSSSDSFITADLDSAIDFLTAIVVKNPVEPTKPASESDRAQAHLNKQYAGSENAAGSRPSTKDINNLIALNKCQGPAVKDKNTNDSVSVRGRFLPSLFDAVTSENFWRRTQSTQTKSRTTSSSLLPTVNDEICSKNGIENGQVLGTGTKPPYAGDLALANRSGRNLTLANRSGVDSTLANRSGGDPNLASRSGRLLTSTTSTRVYEACIKSGSNFKPWSNHEPQGVFTTKNIQEKDNHEKNKFQISRSSSSSSSSTSSEDQSSRDYFFSKNERVKSDRCGSITLSLVQGKKLLDSKLSELPPLITPLDRSSEKSEIGISRTNTTNSTVHENSQISDLVGNTTNTTSVDKLQTSYTDNILENESQTPTRSAAKDNRLTSKQQQQHQLVHDDSFNDLDSPTISKKLPLPTDSNILRHRKLGQQLRRKKHVKEAKPATRLTETSASSETSPASTRKDNKTLGDLVLTSQQQYPHRKRKSKLK